MKTKHQMILSMALLIGVVSLETILSLTDFRCVNQCTARGYLYSVCVHQCSD